MVLAMMRHWMGEITHQLGEVDDGFVPTPDYDTEEAVEALPNTDETSEVKERLSRLRARREELESYRGDGDDRGMDLTH